MSEVLDSGTWKTIDHVAKKARKIFVRRGSSYAWARWNGNEWIYPCGGNEQLDFEPKEYRL